jgi:hypothetical protein
VISRLRNLWCLSAFTRSIGETPSLAGAHAAAKARTASACGSGAHRRDFFRESDLPCFSEAIRPASRNTAKCADMVGFDTTSAGELPTRRTRSPAPMACNQGEILPRGASACES